MIKYVQNKPINWDRIQTLLSESEQAHAFTNSGPIKQKLETLLEAKLDLNKNRRVVCTNNGTSALYILVSLFEKRVGKELKWATISFNFPAANVNRLKTNLLDINLELDGKNIWYDIPLNIISDYDGLIIPTLFGTAPYNLLELDNYCRNNSKILILDNASSPLTKYANIENLEKANSNINNFGTACIGSLHHTKYLGHGENGFAVIPAELYDEFNSLTNFGFTDDRKFNNLASNAKMSDISAAFAFSHIVDYSIERHLKIQNEYVEELEKISNVKVFNKNKDWQIVYGNMPIVFNKPISHLIFRDIGIESNKYYKPLASFPSSNWLFDRIINLPLHASLTDYDLNLILKKVEIEAKNCG